MSAPPWRTGGSMTTTLHRNNNVAYNSVNTRRTLGAGKSSPATTQNSNQKTQFPDALKAYVARTFENCPVDKKTQVEEELKKIITDAFANKTQWTTDWDNFPLPQSRLIPSPISETMDLSSRFSGAKLGEKRKANKHTDDNTIENKTDRPGKKSKIESTYSQEGPDAFDKLNKRYARFNGGQSQSNVKSIFDRVAPSYTDDGAVIGRSTKLEKRYLRLTSAANPDEVRPLHILRETLEFLKRKWKAESNYAYICDQFKSLRQDLTVQHIKNEFTINVYEIHARIALEKGDLGEYNQCQTQLYSLYEEIGGGHPLEFKAYRILYLIHTCNRSDMNEVLANLTSTEKKDHAIMHALAVRSATASGNYHRFFRLLLEAPNMGGYLMDSFVARERLSALCIITKSYRVDIPLRHLTEELGFESDNDCETFLINHNLHAFFVNKTNADGSMTLKLKCQDSMATLEAAKKAAFGKVDIKGQI